MPKFKLILDPEGAALDVDDMMLIGAFATQIAAQFGYPLTSSAGKPLIYQLHLTTGRRVLPNGQRFRDLQLAPETHLALVSSTASAPTRPVRAASLTAATQSSQLLHPQWSRRAFLTTGTLASFAFSGLGTGLAVALAQRYLGRRRLVVAPLVTPPASSTTTRRIIPATPSLTFAGHQQIVRVVAWSTDGRHLASGGEDGQLLVWGTDGMVRQRVVHPAAVTALAWSPESKRLVTGTANQVTFLTALSGTTLARSTHDHFSTVTGLAWTPHNQQQAVSGALDQCALVWQTTQYQHQTIFTHHAAPIESVTWAADGHTIASYSHGGVVRVWDAESGQEVDPLYQDASLPMRVAAFDPIGMQLAVGGDDGVIRLWNGLRCQSSGTITGGTICLDTPRRLRSSRSSIRSLAWSPDAHYLASGSDDGSFSLWDPAQGQNPLLIVAVQPGSSVHSLAWFPAGNQLATAAGRTVIVWNLHNV